MRLTSIAVDLALLQAAADRPQLSSNATIRWHKIAPRSCERATKCDNFSVTWHCKRTPNRRCINVTSNDKKYISAQGHSQFHFKLLYLQRVKYLVVWKRFLLGKTVRERAEKFIEKLPALKHNVQAVDPGGAHCVIYKGYHGTYSQEHWQNVGELMCIVT